MDCSPPGSSIHGTFQARILEWVAISYSRESSSARNQTCVSCVSQMAGRFFTTVLPQSVQSLSHVQLFVTPWIAACQASLPITNSWSLLKLMPIESLMSSNHLSHPLSSWEAPNKLVQFSRSVMCDSLQPHESQHARPPVHHQIPEFTQTHVHRVSDAIQPSHPLSSPSPPAPNPSQHQSLFQ